MWLGRAGNLHIPPVVLTPGMIVPFEDSVYEVCKNLDTLDGRVVSVLKDSFLNLPWRLQQITKI